MFKTPAGRRFGHFSYFGVKLLVVYSMAYDMLKTPAGRRFEQFPYFGVKLIVVCHMVHDMLKTPAGRRLEYIVHTLGYVSCASCGS